MGNPAAPGPTCLVYQFQLPSYAVHTFSLYEKFSVFSIPGPLVGNYLVLTDRLGSLWKYQGPARSLPDST